MVIKKKNYLLRAIWQLMLLFIVVVLVGAFKNVDLNKEKDKEKLSREDNLPAKLIPTDKSGEDIKISDISFGNDKKFDDSLNEDMEDYLILKGEGAINGEEVTIKCKYNIKDGTMVGRYHHKNGTNLDLNGKAFPNGELEIHLGHKSNKTYSKWILNPVEEETSEGVYVFKGYWGKSRKPSNITFKVAS